MNFREFMKICEAPMAGPRTAGGAGMDFWKPPSMSKPVKKPDPNPVATGVKQDAKTAVSPFSMVPGKAAPTANDGGAFSVGQGYISPPQRTPLSPGTVSPPPQPSPFASSNKGRFFLA